MMTLAFLRVGSAIRGSLIVAALSVGLPLHAVGQDIDARVRSFSAAWGQVRLASVDSLFADEVRLTLDGRTHIGVRGQQVVATLSPLLEAHHPAPPSLVRLEPTGKEGRGAFAELRWESTARDTGVPIGYTLLLIFEHSESGWRIVDLRVMP